MCGSQSSISTLGIDPFWDLVEKTLARLSGNKVEFEVVMTVSGRRRMGKPDNKRRSPQFGLIKLKLAVVNLGNEIVAET